MSEIDRVLRGQVSEVKSLVVQVERQLSGVSQQVVAVSTETREARSELDQLRQDFSRFVLQAERTANVGQAETRKAGLLAELEHQFGHYKVVRRTAIGLLQAFDVGIVSQETAHGVSEELMIQTPRYWLAPALVALAAWSGNDRSLCDQAIEEAFRRSPSRTAMFFSLILRRQGRLPSAARWLRQYLDASDPMALGRDFAVILEAVAQGAFGGGGRAQVQEKLALWAEMLSADDVAIAAQVDRWTAEVRTYVGPSLGRRLPQAGQGLPAVATVGSGAECSQRASGATRALLGDARRAGCRHREHRGRRRRHSRSAGQGVRHRGTAAAAATSTGSRQFSTTTGTWRPRRAKRRPNPSPGSRHSTT